MVPVGFPVYSTPDTYSASYLTYSTLSEQQKENVPLWIAGTVAFGTVFRANDRVHSALYIALVTTTLVRMRFSTTSSS